MKRITFLFVLCCAYVLNAQETGQKDLKRTVQKKTYIGLFGANTAVQDAKFSNVVYRGFGGGLNLGTSRENENYFWQTDFSASYAGLSTGLHNGKGFNVSTAYAFKYLHHLNETYAVGGKWNLAAGNLRNFSDLGNNSISIIVNSTLMGTGRYSRTINDDIKLNFDLSIGLLGWVREGTSFAYSANQKVLELGVFNFQDLSTTTPVGVKYGSIETLGAYNVLETELNLQYKRRWQFCYNWSLMNYRTVKGYPLTVGEHRVGVKFNYIAKTKTRTKK